MTLTSQQQSMTDTDPHRDKGPLSWIDVRKRVAGRLSQGLYSELKRFGLRRDLNKPIERPVAKIPIDIRPLREQDLDALLPLTGVNSPIERQEIIWRRDFYNKIPHSCFVAVDKNTNVPCYMQWLIGANDNPVLSLFKCFPELRSHEALLEQAYTPPAYRGLHIMSAAMAMIAERATGCYDARHVITFVEQHNIASLKGCQRAGFYPDVFHRRQQIAFGTFINNSFQALDANDPRRQIAF